MTIVLLYFYLSFWALGSEYFQVQRYVLTGVCSWAGISECLLLFSCDIMYFWYFVSVFDRILGLILEIFSMSINDEWIIRAFLHFSNYGSVVWIHACDFTFSLAYFILGCICILICVSLIFHVSLFGLGVHKGMRIAKLSHTSCYVLCFIGLPCGLDNKPSCMLSHVWFLMTVILDSVGFSGCVNFHM